MLSQHSHQIEGTMVPKLGHSIFPNDKADSQNQRRDRQIHALLASSQGASDPIMPIRFVASYLDPEMPITALVPGQEREIGLLRDSQNAAPGSTDEGE